MSAYSSLAEQLRASPRTFLVTGAAGFIGSHLVEHLLNLGQRVHGLDNLSTGFRENLALVQKGVGEERWKNFTWFEGSVEDSAMVRRAIEGCTVVLHQAALGSVPRSIKEPVASHQANVNGFLEVLEACRAAKVSRLVYASSSSVYGDSPTLPKREAECGQVLSPYALTKLINEQYARLWERTYDLPSIGLRYFNVFGPRQNPNGAYAAVIPRWLAAATRGEACTIYGDGETSRDFCAIENVIQANLLAAFAPRSATGAAYNIAVGMQTSLREIHDTIWRILVERKAVLHATPPILAPFREGDIRHSLADITMARTQLGFEPTVTLAEGLRKLVESV